MIKFLIIGVLALSCSKLQIDQEKVSTSPILNKAISEIALRYDDEFSQCPKIKGYCTRDIVKLYHLGKKEDAFAKAKKLCRKEQDPNCRALGVLYSADLQMNKSRDTLAKGCVKGDSQSCSLYAFFVHIYENDLDKKIKILKRSCELGYHKPCHLLFNHYNNKDKKQEIFFRSRLKSICSKTNDFTACHASSISTYANKSEKRRSELDKLCKKGHNESCVYLINIKSQGQKNAWDEFKRSCDDFKNGYYCHWYSKYQEDRGNLDLAKSYGEKACWYRRFYCDYIGNLESEKGNDQVALKFFSFSCRDANKDGCLREGLIEHLYGNKKRSIDLLEKGCFLGSEESCQKAIQLTIKEEKKRSALIAKRSCDYGSGQGCASLAYLNHVDDRQVKAGELYQKSCNEYQNLAGCYGTCMIYAENSKLSESRAYLIKACEFSKDKNDLCHSLIENEEKTLKLSKEKLLRSCHYDPKKPWWRWLVPVLQGIGAVI